MSAESSEKTRRILVAEDTEVIALLMKESLTKAGYEVEVAVDGEACLLAIEQFRPDLLILDLMMPKLHGIEVLKRVRADALTADLAVMVCSAKALKAERVAAVDLGALAFIPKPFLPADLLDPVEGFFDGTASLFPSAVPAAVAPIGDPYEPQRTSG